MLAGLKESTPGSVLVDAGDATQGLPLASLTKGADVIELMNLAGYDLMTAGNHEFDFGTEQFWQMQRWRISLFLRLIFTGMESCCWKDSRGRTKGVMW